MNDYEQQLIKYIKDKNLGELYTNYTFKMITTLKVGGSIALMYFPNSDDSLLIVLSYLRENKIKYIIIGNGSNILASDNFYDGVVISLKRIANQFIIEKLEDDKYLVGVNAGCSAKKFCELLSEHSLTGAEAIGSIPATIGGIVAMNASCYDFVSSKYLKRALVIIDNNIRWLDSSELDFTYRSSKILNENLILLKVEFIFKKGKHNEIINKMEYINQKRKKTQPMHLKSAGSTFKNSSLYNAWEVIEKLGLRGYRIGDAMVSLEHTNFLVNVSNASSNDFLKLINLIKKKALEQLNIDLKTEWILINF